MQIYLEYIFIANFLIMLVNLIIISHLFKFHAIKTKLIVSSLIYGFISCLICFNVLSSFETFLLQASITCFSLSFSFKKMSFKKIFQAVLVYFLISNTYSSIMQLLFNQKYMYGSLIASSINLFLSLFGLLIIGFMLSKILDIFLRKKKINANIVDGELMFKNKKIPIQCYLDTGNTMSYNDKPVNFINFELFKKLTNENLADVLNKSNQHEYITVNTISGTQKLIKLELNNLDLKINNKLINNPIFALSLKLNSNYEIILNNSYF